MARAVELNPMKCPRCGVWVRVLETRMDAEGAKRRRYECANLHRFSTKETIVLGRPSPAEKGKAIAQMLAKAIRSTVGSKTSP